MATKKRAQQNKEATKPSAAKQSKARQKAAKNYPWLVPFILILTFIAYIPALKAGFVSWDDPDYATENLLIRNLSNLKLVITTPVQGNYHPLTMISLALNYAISGLDPWSYHLLNLLLHLVDCFLVYRLAMLLTNKNVVIAFTTAVLFAVHPLHVESVAWVAERKDVLYGLFFLAGLISYTKYVDTGSSKQYLLTILFLILSLASKPAAVIFPVVLFCIDLLRKRKLSFKLFWEKAPFFLFALILGILTMTAQKQVGATGIEYFSTGTNILFGFYGIMVYFFKLIFPIYQSAFYPFPAVNETLSIEYFLSPLLFIALAVLFFYQLKRNRMISFGIAFYIVNLLLVLQIVSVGSAVVAERYTYIPYIGLFFIVGWLINRYAKGQISKAFTIIIPLSLLFAILTFRQAGVWHDTASMWDQAIRHHPSSRAYSARGALFRKEQPPQLEKAKEYYQKAIAINAVDHESYTNLGNVYFDQNKLDSAYANYRAALNIKPDYWPALDNMGAQYATKGNFDSALFYFAKAIKAKPDYRPVYKNRALVFMELKRWQESINDFRKFMQPGDETTYLADADIYNDIGFCYRSEGKLNEALAEINKAISLDDPSKPHPQFYLNRSYTYFGLNNKEQAKQDALKAKQGGVVIDASFLRSLGL